MFLRVLLISFKDQNNRYQIKIEAISSIPDF